MKRFCLCLILLGPLFAFAQDQPKSKEMTELSAPLSPAFMIVDISPTLIQNPTTPKSLVLGIAQSFSKSSSAFPDNYSVSFTPYWWLQPKGRSVYKFLGINEPGKEKSKGLKPFSGLKFTTVSAAFVTKDLVPDAAETNQKIFSIGIRSTIIQVHTPKHVAKLYKALDDWHFMAIAEIDKDSFNVKIADSISRLKRDSTFDKKRRDLLSKLKETTGPSFKKVNDLINVKPVFAWDVAAATAIYGLDNNSTASGRTGVWTTFSSYIPLGKDSTEINKNYIDIHATARYLRDNYQKNDDNLIGRGNNLDFGGKVGFIFNQLSFGIEAIYRHNNGIANAGNRTVGTIGVRVAKDIYVNGAFGKDFAGPNKLISIFGISWGFGDEQLSLP